MEKYTIATETESFVNLCCLRKSFSGKASAEIRGEFFPTKSWVNLQGNFGGFFRPFVHGKTGGNNPPKIHGKIQIRIWEFRGQNPHCKDLALNLFPGQWPKQISYNYTENHMASSILTLCPVLLSAKTSSSHEQVGVWFDFPRQVSFCNTCWTSTQNNSAGVRVAPSCCSTDCQVKRYYHK